VIGIGNIPLNGVVFRVYKVDTSVDVPPSGLKYVVSGSNMLVFDGATQVGSYPITPASPASLATGISGVASFTNLPTGVYLVVEDISSSQGNITNANTDKPVSVSSRVANFLVAVPMANPAGTDWLTDVHVYPKDEELTIEKTVTTNPSIEVGSSITYKIRVSIPAAIKAGDTFTITDSLDEALTLTLSSTTVTASALTVAPAGSNTLIAVTDYNAAHTLVPASGGGGLLTFTLTNAGIAKATGHEFVEVLLTVKVNSKVLDYADDDNVIGNEATITFTNTEGDSFTASTDEGGGGGSDTHIASIQVTKVDQNGDELLGAKFKIATSPENAVALRFLRRDSSGVLLDYGAVGYSTATDVEVTTDADGLAYFTGLQDFNGSVARVYYIVETEAPAGYNLLTAPVTASFGAAYYDGVDDHYILELPAIRNSEGFTLPSTGGTGTIVFTVAGIVLLGLAVMLAIKPRSRRSQKS
jgi:fimbrial isopeptide formation D2 family protein/LPXTG-motif cell wall-anchored protein